MELTINADCYKSKGYLISVFGLIEHINQSFLSMTHNYKKLSKKNQPINGSLLGDWILWMKCIYDASISIEMHRCIHFNSYFTKIRKKFEKLMKLIVKRNNLVFIFLHNIQYIIRFNLLVTRWHLYEFAF